MRRPAACDLSRGIVVDDAAGTDRLIARALRTETTDQIRANALWTQAERRIVDQAATVPLFNPKAIELVSPRVGGVQRSPQWGLLLDQLWVR
jgi:ABC-type transport system substrate-binding protein